MTVASQRVQIVLYRLQAQEAAVSRAAQRPLDERAHLASAQDRTRSITAEIQMAEDRASHTQNAAERKELDDELPRLRSRLEGFRKDEQNAEAGVSDAENALKREQQQLTSLQDFLDQLDKVLSGLAPQ
ncbi:MAG: hypothetical protein JO041_04830 [Acidobacteria bacterium]|nr:hypothetical protein [Acidobacteriota bacterium]